MPLLPLSWKNPILKVTERKWLNFCNPFTNFLLNYQCVKVSFYKPYFWHIFISMFYGLTISSYHGFSLKTKLCEFLKLLFKPEYIERSHLNMKLCHFHALKRYSKKQKQNKNKNKQTSKTFARFLWFFLSFVFCNFSHGTSCVKVS